MNPATEPDVNESLTEDPAELDDPHAAPTPNLLINNFWRDSVVPAVREGPISSGEFVEAATAYQRPDAFRSARAALVKGRFVVLTGPPGIGRRTTALNLLGPMPVSEWRAIEPDDITRLTPRDLRADCGYLVESLHAAVPDGRVTAMTLRALADTVRRAGAVMVATCVPVEDTDGDPYLFPCDLPDPARTLRAHLTATLGRADFDDSELLGARVCARLAAHRAGGVPPAQVVVLARNLARVESGDLSLDDALRALDDEDRDHVRTWLSQMSTDPAMIALAMAVAVFEGVDSHLVGLAADRLAMGLAGNGFPGPEPAAAPRPRSSRMSDIGAEEVEAIQGGHARFRISIPRFLAPARGRLLLEVWWEEYERHRDILLTWLATAPSQDGAHRMAGRAAGRVLTLLSGYAAMRAIRTWAGHSEPRLRVMAAEALSAAAEVPGFAPVVRAELRNWGRPDASRNRRWTAATVLGGPYGASRPDTALRQLRGLAHHDDEALRLAIVRSMTDLYESERHAQTHNAWRSWIHDPAKPVRDCAMAVAWRVLGRSTSGRASPERKPVLVGRRQDGPMAVDLLVGLLGSPHNIRPVLDTLIDWSGAPGTRDWAVDISVDLLAACGSRTRGALAYELQRVRFEAPGRGGLAPLTAVVDNLDSFEEEM